MLPSEICFNYIEENGCFARETKSLDLHGSVFLLTKENELQSERYTLKVVNAYTNNDLAVILRHLIVIMKIQKTHLMEKFIKIFNFGVVKIETIFKIEYKIFIKQEYIEGNTLNVVLENSTSNFGSTQFINLRDSNFVVSLSTCLLKAIQELHYLGISHSDISPDNIMISSSDTETNKSICKIINLHSITLPNEINILPEQHTTPDSQLFQNKPLHMHRFYYDYISLNKILDQLVQFVPIITSQEIKIKNAIISASNVVLNHGPELALETLNKSLLSHLDKIKAVFKRKNRYDTKN